MAENVEVAPSAVVEPSAGSAGQNTQLPGQATTVDGLAAASGGVGPGNLFETDIDKNLFEFESDDNPLMQLMLAAKRVEVKAPVVQHYQLDEEKTSIATTAAVTANSNNTQFTLPVAAADKKLCQICGTLRVRGVAGYAADGSTKTPKIDLMLYVTGRDTSGNITVMAVNGPKANATDVECTTPAIPAGCVIDILSNAMHETQLMVEPNSSLPVPETIYLQKRGMNRIVSDYFESAKKRIPFTNALLAERDLRKFKRDGNRTLWAGVQGMFPVMDDKAGLQNVYCTKGILYQFKRVMEHSNKWTFEDFISLAKMFFTGVDVPKGAYCLCGKNFLENIQTIDFSKHPEVHQMVKTNPLGWSVNTISTVFGDFQFKWEPTLDKLGFSNSAAILGVDRLVHYQRITEHKRSEEIEGHEAKRESLVVWDALALKGSCHVFVNGEIGENVGAEDAINFQIWDGATAPTADDGVVDGALYYLTATTCAMGSKTGSKGQLWKATVSGDTITWNEYSSTIPLG